METILELLQCIEEITKEHCPTTLQRGKTVYHEEKRTQQIIQLKLQKNLFS